MDAPAQQRGAGEVPIPSTMVHHLHFSDPLAIVISSSQSVLSFFKCGLVSISGETYKRSINKIKYAFFAAIGFKFVSDTHHLLLLLFNIPFILSGRTSGSLGSLFGEMTQTLTPEKPDTPVTVPLQAMITILVLLQSKAKRYL